jgi:hypothetical protein
MCPCVQVLGASSPSQGDDDAGPASVRRPSFSSQASPGGDALTIAWPALAQPATAMTPTARHVMLRILTSVRDIRSALCLHVPHLQQLLSLSPAAVQCPCLVCYLHCEENVAHT